MSLVPGNELNGGNADNRARNDSGADGGEHGGERHFWHSRSWSSKSGARCANSRNTAKHASQMMPSQIIGRAPSDGISQRASV